MIHQMSCLFISVNPASRLKLSSEKEINLKGSTGQMLADGDFIAALQRSDIKGICNYIAMLEN